MTYARPIKVTPSDLEDQAYQAMQTGRRIVDANGVPFPDITYRKSDADLLAILSKKAFTSWRDSLLTADRLTAVAEALDAALAARFPAADVAAFARHGATRVSETVNVQIEAGPRSFQKPVWVNLPAPREFPVLPETRGHLMVAQVAGVAPAGEDPRIPVPAETLAYFADVMMVREAERLDFQGAAHWASIFKVSHGRYPKWREIEDRYPRIGAWMQASRAAQKPRARARALSTEQQS